jgi:hypothetical protein
LAGRKEPAAEGEETEPAPTEPPMHG